MNKEVEDGIKKIVKDFKVPNLIMGRIDKKAESGIIKSIVGDKVSKLSVYEKDGLAKKFFNFTQETLKDTKELDPDEAFAIYSATLEKWPKWERILYLLCLRDIAEDHEKKTKEL